MQVILKRLRKCLKLLKIPNDFFCASANIYSIKPVYKLIHSRTAKEYRGQATVLFWRRKLS